MWYGQKHLKAILLFSTIYLSSAGLFGQQTINLLVFSKTEAYRHQSISKGIFLIDSLAKARDCNVLFTENSTVFSTATLDSMDVVIFLNTSGDILDQSQESVFEDFIENGGGFIGVHAASDTEYEWAWYGNLVGSYFHGHPEIQTATLKVTDSSHPSTVNIHDSIVHQDEWYNFKTPFPTKLSVVLQVDETSYSGGTMGEFHPISWYHLVGAGRAFYTALGHTESTYSNTFFIQHLLGAIRWTAGITSTVDKHIQERPKFQLFPNPCGNFLHLKFLENHLRSQTLTYTVRDIHGCTVKQGEILATNTELKLNLEHLRLGLYYIEIKKQSTT